MFAAHWPHASAEEQTLAQPLNSRPKYVASTTLTEPLGWRNSTLLRGDLGFSVRTLKQTGNGELLVIGSPDLVQSLLDEDLVDEFRLMIDPIVLGSGKRLFAAASQPGHCGSSNASNIHGSDSRNLRPSARLSVPDPMNRIRRRRRVDHALFAGILLNGSGQLVNRLSALGLIDEYRFMMFHCGRRGPAPLRYLPTAPATDG